MARSDVKEPSFVMFSLKWLSFSLMLCFLLSSCARSPWIKPDGTEVSPKEQLACAEHLEEDEENHSLDHNEMKEKIEICMTEKGYRPRPWWLLNDLRWQGRSAY